MIRIYKKIPHEVTLACSGGIDSVAILDFLSKSKRKVTLAFFNHGTETSEKSLPFIFDLASKYDYPLLISKVQREQYKSESLEEYWRIQRYEFLNSLPGLVITGHHLDDLVETWVFTSLHGKPKLIPYQNKNVIRPFILTRKHQFISWCKNNQLDWFEDHSNLNLRFSRNRIRHQVIPELLKINPGLHKVIAREFIKYEQYSSK